MTDQRPAWTDERLDRAFHARFDRPAPPETADLLHVALASSKGPVNGLWARRTWPPQRSVWAVAVVSVALVVVASLSALQPRPITPGPSTGATGVSGTVEPGSPGPEPSKPDDVAMPETIAVPGSSTPQPVLSVEQAYGVRDSNDPGREVVVGAWYSFTPVPCAQIPNSTSLLESCAVDFTWLYSAPDHLELPSPLQSPGGWGPLVVGINVVMAYTNWDPPPADGRTHPVVVLGHFHDKRATDCPEGDRRARCERLFVVDAPLWTPAGVIDVAAAPSVVDGMPVKSVREAMEIRDGGSSETIAMAGWLRTPTAVFGCRYGSGTGRTWLEGRCVDDFRWVMSAPELLIPPSTIDPGFEIGWGRPQGPAIQPAFDPDAIQAPLGNGEPNEGFPNPMPIIFIGHFNDPRSSGCTDKDPNPFNPGDPVAQCRARFVVEAVVWRNGQLVSPGS